MDGFRLPEIRPLKAATAKVGYFLSRQLLVEFAGRWEWGLVRIESFFILLPNVSFGPATTRVKLWPNLCYTCLKRALRF